MKLQIERKYVEAMVDEFPGLAALKDQLRFGNKAEVPFKDLSNTELSFLQVLYKQAGTEMQGRAAQLS
ncbi:MAG: AAA family ATPase, partial [Methylococcaceae bacterium]|nr:AAA family ATPase [Methylococcaceae bacterium]